MTENNYLAHFDIKAQARRDIPTTIGCTLADEYSAKISVFHFAALTRIRSLIFHANAINTRVAKREQFGGEGTVTRRKKEIPRKVDLTEARIVCHTNNIFFFADEAHLGLVCRDVVCQIGTIRIWVIDKCVLRRPLVSCLPFTSCFFFFVDRFCVLSVGQGDKIT